MSLTLASAADFLRPDLPVFAALPVPPSRRQPHFFSLAGHGSLDQVLLRPFNLFLEVGKHDALDDSLAEWFVGAPAFVLSLTTPTAFRREVARTVAAHVYRRFGMQDRRQDIETCLQEATTNAVVHGSLEIDSTFLSLSGMEAYYARIANRLQEEPYKHRRVTFTAWDRDDHMEIAVSDEGLGFQMSSGLPPDALPYGRGMMLMQSLADHICIGDDRRSVHMVFTY